MFKEPSLIPYYFGVRLVFVSLFVDWPVNILIVSDVFSARCLVQQKLSLSNVSNRRNKLIIA